VLITVISCLWPLWVLRSEQELDARQQDRRRRTWISACIISLAAVIILVLTLINLPSTDHISIIVTVCATALLLGALLAAAVIVGLSSYTALICGLVLAFLATLAPINYMSGPRSPEGAFRRSGTHRSCATGKYHGCFLGVCALRCFACWVCDMDRKGAFCFGASEIPMAIAGFVCNCCGA